MEALTGQVVPQAEGSLASPAGRREGRGAAWREAGGPSPAHEPRRGGRGHACCSDLSAGPVVASQGATSLASEVPAMG